jgi:hypothetical protein
MLKPACLGLCWGFAVLLSTPAAYAQSRATVVELYTSEGCSSCAPAEAQIGRLAMQDGVIALAFHVDYWDSLGWRDRFALPEATARQRQYAQALHLSTVYTPQLVIDGQRDMVGGGDGIGASSGQKSGVPLGISVQNNSVVVALGAQQRQQQQQQQLGPYDVLLLGYLPEAVSKVTRGENAGHELHELNIVRSIRKLGTWQGESKTYSVPLTASPADATGVVVLVQQPDQGAIIGAASSVVR